MRFVIKNNENLQSLFSRVEEPSYVEDKAQCYDSKKLQEWETSFNEILPLLKGAENQEGLRLLIALAEEGYPEARWLLSDMYLEGRIVPESFQKAVEWDRKAKFAEGLYRNKLK